MSHRLTLFVVRTRQKNLPPAKVSDGFDRDYSGPSPVAGYRFIYSFTARSRSTIAFTSESANGFPGKSATVPFNSREPPRFFFSDIPSFGEASRDEEVPADSVNHSEVQRRGSKQILHRVGYELSALRAARNIEFGVVRVYGGEEGVVASFAKNRNTTFPATSEGSSSRRRKTDEVVRRECPKPWCPPPAVATHHESGACSVIQTPRRYRDDPFIPDARLQACSSLVAAFRRDCLAAPDDPRPSSCATGVAGGFFKKLWLHISVSYLVDAVLFRLEWRSFVNGD